MLLYVMYSWLFVACSPTREQLHYIGPFAVAQALAVALARHATTWHGMAWRGTGMPGQAMARHAMARHAITRHDMIRL